MTDHTSMFADLKRDAHRDLHELRTFSRCHWVPLDSLSSRLTNTSVSLALLEVLVTELEGQTHV